MCSQRCRGDSESERLTGKGRERERERGPVKSHHLLCLPRRGFDCCRFMAAYRGMRLVRSLEYTRSPSSSGPILRPAIQAHWANDKPGQLKSLCESVWHQEGHLLPALKHSLWPVGPLAGVTAHPACREMVTGSEEQSAV